MTMASSTLSPNSLPDLSGRVYLVTGGNAGIGKETVIGLATRGAKVYMAGRSQTKGLEAIREIKSQTPSVEIHFLQLDLSSLTSVIAAARQLRKNETALHGLINNAGIMAVPFATTDDGYEIQFQTNYVSHWLLTHHLLPLLTETSAATSDAARVVNVTSDGHSYAPEGGINFDDISLETENAMTRYGQSKLANILHAKELNRRHGPNSDKGENSAGFICVAAVHPGHIDTGLNKQATGMAPSCVLRVATPIMRCVGILDDREKGAWSSLFAVASNDFKLADSGAYVIPYMKVGSPSAYAQDAALAAKLWTWTEDKLAAGGFLHLN